VLLVPAQRQLFIGAGTRPLAYQARSDPWRRCWVDEAEYGFWGWRKHEDVVVMSAELELAAALPAQALPLIEENLDRYRRIDESLRGRRGGAAADGA
jgi:hypothetical protein